jgi:hypothetical protein
MWGLASAPRDFYRARHPAQVNVNLLFPMPFMHYSKLVLRRFGGHSLATSFPYPYLTFEFNPYSQWASLNLST